MNSQTDARDVSIEHSEGLANAQTVLGFAVFGCLFAGFAGVFKAFTMPTGLDVFFCLAGSTLAFGTVFYLYLRK